MLNIEEEAVAIIFIRIIRILLSLDGDFLSFLLFLDLDLDLT